MQLIAPDTSAPEDPFAGYVPVKMVHPVVDVGDVPDLPPSERPRRWKPPRRRKPGRSLVSGCGTLVFLLCAAIAVVVIAIIAYGYFYDRPVTAVMPELAVCARPVNALSEWGRAARARLTEFAGTNLARRLTLGFGSSSNVVSQSLERVSAIGVQRRSRQDEAQLFADGFD